MDSYQSIQLVSEYLESATLLPDTIQIILFLLGQRIPCSTAFISENLKVSNRKVLYSVNKDILKLFKYANIHMICKPKTGLFVNESLELKLYLKEKIIQFSMSYSSNSKEKRREKILINLLSGQRFIEPKKLQLSFDCSKKTIYSDVQWIKSILKQRNMNLYWKKPFGFGLVGEERCIRKLLVESTLNFFNYDILMGLCRNWIKNDPEKTSLSKHKELFYMAKQPLRYYWDSIWLYSQQQKIMFSDKSILELVVYIAVIVDSLENDFYLEEEKLLTEEPQEFLSLMSHTILTKTLVMRNISPNSLEIDFFYSVLLHEYNSMIEQKQRANCNYDTEKIKNLAETISSIASKYLLPNLMIDNDLIEGLKEHLTISIDRLNSNQTIINNNTAIVKNIYPFIFQVAEKCMRQVEIKSGIVFPSDEITFIAMHLIAAMDRLSISKSIEKNVIFIVKDSTEGILLKARIEKEYPQIKIIKIVHHSNLSESDYLLGKVDFIISTMHIAFSSLAIAVVTPLINEQDKSIINRFLLPLSNPQKNRFRGTIHDLFSLSELLTDKFVELNAEAVNWEDAIEKTSLLLERNSVVTSDYSRVIINSLKLFGPYMVLWPEVALLHAKPSDGVKKLGVALCRFIKPVVFNHKDNDPVSICFILSATDNLSHLRILNEITYLCSSTDFVKEVKEIGTKQKLFKYIQTECTKVNTVNFQL